MITTEQIINAVNRYFNHDKISTCISCEVWQNRHNEKLATEYHVSKVNDAFHCTAKTFDSFKDLITFINNEVADNEYRKANEILFRRFV